MHRLWTQLKLSRPRWYSRIKRINRDSIKGVKSYHIHDHPSKLKTLRTFTMWVKRFSLEVSSTLRSSLRRSSSKSSRSLNISSLNSSNLMKPKHNQFSKGKGFSEIKSQVSRALQLTLAKKTAKNLKCSLAIFQILTLRFLWALSSNPTVHISLGTLGMVSLKLISICFSRLPMAD